MLNFWNAKLVAFGAKFSRQKRRNCRENFTEGASKIKLTAEKLKLKAKNVDFVR